MELGLGGRTAIVSGASRGLGEAVARRLVDEGCNVVLASTRPPADAVATALRSVHPGRVASVDVDLTTRVGAAAAVQEAVARFGAPDIVVTNVAGYADTGEPGPHPRRWSDLPLEEVALVVRQQVLSAYWLAEAALPHMRKAHWGRILNISSRAAREVEVDVPHVLSNMARPAAASLYRALARDVLVDGITVNTLMPGAVTTHRAAEAMAEMAARDGRTLAEVEETLHSKVALHRGGKVEELSALAAFLCSERAESITGQGILIEGGTNRSVY